MTLDPAIWGPKYWFVLHTIALSYPLNPNDVVKKKYYDFIQNLPLFMPVSEIGDNFCEILDKYPVTPYLDSRQSFMKWMHFIHNKINLSQKPPKPEVSMEDAMFAYYEHYKPKAVIFKEERKRREKYIFAAIMIIALGLAYKFY